MWITNGSIADLYTVFAKVGGEHFTAFLVERGWAGVKPGEEEKKMGLKGSSTTALYFDNVHVPVENVLGEVGKGHKIAFNILNLGRLKLAMFAQGEAREALAHSLRYAKDRVAFGKPIGEFGLIQQKLAEMAARMYANESMAYRVTGLIQDGGDVLRAGEEFAVECSLVKVFGSEMLGFVTDEAVQIHGGYGYHQDYAVERLYRDARIYRIFEGTNEINRLLAPGMLRKRAKAGRIELPAAEEHPVTPRDVALALLHRADEAQQEQLAAATDAMMYALAIDSAELRAGQSGSAQARDLAVVFREFAVTQIETAARMVCNVCLEHAADNLNGVRHRIATRLLAAGKYVV
jgi:hypothetical protein